MNESCPRINGLSAYVDRALASGEQSELESHLSGCPICGAALAELDALRATFRALPEEKLAFDMGALILGRLPPQSRTARSKPRSPLRQLAPLSLGAAAALAAGIYLGSLLVGAAGVVAPPRVAGMALFDAVPPGALCAGDSACYRRAR
jgi:anti-sigma factor RsiW